MNVRNACTGCPRHEIGTEPEAVPGMLPQTVPQTVTETVTETCDRSWGGWNVQYYGDYLSIFDV